jgi:hypothetical protein
MELLLKIKTKVDCYVKSKTIATSYVQVKNLFPIIQTYGKAEIDIKWAYGKAVQWMSLERQLTISKAPLTTPLKMLQ